MVRVKILLVLVLGLSLLSIFPVKSAYSDEIRFNVNTTEVQLSRIGIICNGPFLRTSGCVPIGDGLGRFNRFYSAEINFLSPFGTWVCTVHADSICFASPTGRGTFCLETRSPQNSVDITLEQTVNIFNDAAFRFTSNYPEGICRSLSTNAFLGDRPQQSRPDRDTFSFEDTGGDEITLTLEEDGSVGHIGEEANFRIRGPIGSTSLDEFRTGELPLEITATIPESGEYEIVVDQKNIPDDFRYRGGFIITLISSFDDVGEIVPSKDVE